MIDLPMQESVKVRPNDKDFNFNASANSSLQHNELIDELQQSYWKD